MKTTKGYAYYAKMNDKIHTYGDEKVIDFFVDLQVWGTPEQCYEKILDVRRRVGNDHFVGVFSYAGMPYDMAEKNLRLFASEVVPRLKLHLPVRAAAVVPSRPTCEGSRLASGVSEVLGADFVPAKHGGTPPGREDTGCSFKTRTF
jgi:hypothetical protein